MPLLLAVDIVSFYQTKNVIKESWHLKDRKQIEYDSLQKYNDNKWFENSFLYKNISVSSTYTWLHLTLIEGSIPSYITLVFLFVCWLSLFLIVWKLQKRVLSSACYGSCFEWHLYRRVHTHIYISPEKGTRCMERQTYSSLKRKSLWGQ